MIVCQPKGESEQQDDQQSPSDQYRAAHSLVKSQIAGEVVNREMSVKST